MSANEKLLWELNSYWGSRKKNTYYFEQEGLQFLKWQFFFLIDTPSQLSFGFNMLKFWQKIHIYCYLVPRL